MAGSRPGGSSSVPHLPSVHTRAESPGPRCKAADHPHGGSWLAKTCVHFQLSEFLGKWIPITLQFSISERGHPSPLTLHSAFPQCTPHSAGRGIPSQRQSDQATLPPRALCGFPLNWEYNSRLLLRPRRFYMVWNTTTLPAFLDD